LLYIIGSGLLQTMGVFGRTSQTDRNSRHQLQPGTRQHFILWTWLL